MPYNPLSSLTSSTTGANRVQTAIAFASQKTGVDFSYLLGQAKLGSGLKANARSGTSSATGLYQFVDQSWLGVIKQHGSEYGLGWAADAIHAGAHGRLTVSDPGTKAAILAMRNAPQVASLMAAEHASDNQTALQASLGRLNGTAATTTTAASLLRPTPDTARLAYMMLASLGG